MKAEEFLKRATKGTEAGEIIEESHLRLAIIALLDNYREVLVKECSIPDVSHSYYQVVLNGAHAVKNLGITPIDSDIIVLAVSRKKFGELITENNCYVQTDKGLTEVEQGTQTAAAWIERA